MFKYNQNQLPPIFDNIFKKNSQIHSYNTRQHFHIPLITRSKRQSTVAYQGPIIGNYFDQRLNANRTLNTYKKDLRTYLRQNIIDL